MRTKTTTCVLFLGVATCHAGIPVSVVADATATINQAQTMTQWALQFKKWQEQINQAKAVASYAHTLKEYAGDPKAAVAKLGDISKIRADLTANLGSTKTIGNFAAGQISVSDVWKDAGVGGTFTVGGTALARDASLYESERQWGGVVDGSAQVIATNRAAENKILAEAQNASDHLRNARTESEKQMAAAEISRLSLATQQVQARNQAVMADLQLAAEKRRLRDQARSIAEQERLAAEAKQQAAADSADLQARRAQHDAGMRLVNETPVDWTKAINH